MRRKFFFFDFSGVCRNHDPAAGDGGGTPTPPANPPADPPPADPPANPPADPPVPEGYVPATEVETERTARTAAETRATELEARATAAEARARQTEIQL